MFMIVHLIYLKLYSRDGFRTQSIIGLSSSQLPLSDLNISYSFEFQKFMYESFTIGSMTTSSFKFSWPAESGLFPSYIWSLLKRGVLLLSSWSIFLAAEAPKLASDSELHVFELESATLCLVFVLCQFVSCFLEELFRFNILQRVQTSCKNHKEIMLISVSCAYRSIYIYIYMIYMYMHKQNGRCVMLLDSSSRLLIN